MTTTQSRAGGVHDGRPSLYVDVGSPFAYFAVERAREVLGVAPVLRPVLLGGLFRLVGRSSWARGAADHPSA